MNTHFIDYKHFIQQSPFLKYENFLSETSVAQIKNIITVFERKYLINNKKEMIVNLLKHNVDGDWVKRIKESEKYKRASCSLEACIIRYGDITGREIYSENIEKVKCKKERYTNNRWKEICKSKRSNLGLDGYVKKFGMLNGTNRWNEYQKKWKRGIESRKKRGKWKNGRSLGEFQEKWGIEEGYKRWRSSYDKRNYTLSLPGFIQRFGLENGTSKYYQHIEKMVSNCRCGIPYSKISQELFGFVYSNLDDQKRIETKYFTLNGEQVFYIVSIMKQKTIYVDFKCKNVIIEFDGDYWHSSLQVQKNDSERDNFLRGAGYKILRIKEKDYLKDKTGTAEKCVNFVNENYERT